MIIRMRAHLSQDEQDLVARRVVETRKMIAAAKESDRLQDAAIRRREREIAEQRAAAFRERQSEMEFSAPYTRLSPPGCPRSPQAAALGAPYYPPSRPSGRVRGIVA